ncbi:hypothetical protein D3C78_293880 [compost metagenome]
MVFPVLDQRFQIRSLERQRGPGEDCALGANGYDRDVAQAQACQLIADVGRMLADRTGQTGPSRTNGHTTRLPPESIARIEDRDHWFAVLVDPCRKLGELVCLLALAVEAHQHEVGYFDSLSGARFEVIPRVAASPAVNTWSVVDPAGVPGQWLDIRSPITLALRNR